MFFTFESGLISLILIYLILMYAIVIIKKDPSIGNFTWGGGCILTAIYTYTSSSFFFRQTLVTTLICIWGIRLATYLYLRYKKGADPRFVDWQKKWGFASYIFSFLWVVFLQGLLLLIMSYPGIFTNLRSQSGITALDIFGLLLWIFGFYFESVGDYQLYKFLKNPENKGKIMDQGLWKYTRHPNYFGEITMWWSIFLIIISIPGGWVTIIAPLTITILLIFITGIAMNEKVLENNPEFQKYKKRTNMLIPGWPK